MDINNKQKRMNNQQVYYDALSQQMKSEDLQEFYDALSFHKDQDQNLSYIPVIHRKRKSSQIPYITSLNQDNIIALRSCLDTLPLVKTILNLCKKEKVFNIFIVDGPNMGFEKTPIFKDRQKFLTGKAFRQTLIDNSTKDLNLFIIVSQKQLKKTRTSIIPTCEDMLTISKIITQNKHFFVNITVACYDKNTNHRCMVPNETDDYVRKYLAYILLLKFSEMKHHISIYEISNDKSKNWYIDKKFKAPIIPFQRAIFKLKKSSHNTKTPVYRRSVNTRTKSFSPKIWVKKKVNTDQYIKPSKLPIFTNVPLIFTRPMYTHVNMPSGTAHQFGINSIVARGLIQRMKRKNIPVDT